LNNKNLSSLIAILLVIIIGNSCKKDTGIIGLDKIQLITDSLSAINTYNVLTDSMLSNLNTRALIGKYVDTDFGTSSSLFITQLRPMNNEPNIEGLEFDSISFDFQINTLYGSIVSNVKIEIFEVTESLTDLDSVYKSNLNIDNYLNSPINMGETLISLDTVKANTDTSLVSVRLNEYVENKIFNPDGQTFEEVVADDSSFYEYFNGICIKMTHLNTPNSFVGFLRSEINSLNVHFSKIDTLYANTDSAKIVRTPSKFAFYISNVNGFNAFDHQYNNTIQFDAVNNDSITYIETMSGINTVIDLESLATWKDSSNVIINNALLYVYFDSVNTDKLLPPQQIIIYQHSDVNINNVITDYSSSSGVEFVYINNDLHQYAIRLTEHLQDYILGKTDNISIRLFPSENYSSARNGKIYSGNHELKPKLFITYSKL
jgi:uncharacterized protein DUF4270